jgi:hypothetical protein
MIDLQPAELSIFSPELGTLPIFRTRRDYLMSKKLFGTEHRSGLNGNQSDWRVASRLGLFNMASDSGLFNEKPDLEAAGLKLTRSMSFRGQGKELYPIYEGAVAEVVEIQGGVVSG